MNRPGLSRASWLIAAAAIVLHAAVLTRYGWFRDELYYAASTHHLSWGYVDHPPLSIALLWVVTKLFGIHLAVIRFVPALAHATVVLLTAALARRLGGGGFAQGLAAVAALLAPGFLGTTHFYSMNAIELVLWPLAALLVLRALETRSRRDWALLGFVLGLGLMNKISMSWFGMGLFAGLLLTEHRRALATPGPWIAAAIAAAVFMPYVAWEFVHGWPTLEFMRNASSLKMVAVSPVDFVRSQLLEFGPANVLVWGAGLVFAFTPGGRRGRLLAWIYLATALLLAAGGRSRPSYLGPAYPFLFALGGPAWEAMLSRGWSRRLRPVLPALLVVTGLALAPFAIPVLSPETFVRFQAACDMAPSTSENQAVGPLPQHYADMFGWEDLVATVAKACDRLTPEERKHCRVFGQNYGEAGAVDVLGARYGLPRAMSGHNSYWIWGPGDFDGSVLIIIGGDHEDNLEFFEDVEVVGTVDNPWAMPYERGLPVSIARRPRRDLRGVWADLRMFI